MNRAYAWVFAAAACVAASASCERILGLDEPDTVVDVLPGRDGPSSSEGSAGATTGSQGGAGGGSSASSSGSGGVISCGDGGGPPCDDPRWAHWNPEGSKQYQIGNETVYDPLTSLTWQVAVKDGVTWDDAIAYCEGLNLADSDDWHLPTRIELLSIVDYTTHDPAIDLAAFPSTPSSDFWTSSELADNPESGYQNPDYLGKKAGFVVRFNDGGSGPWKKAQAYHARCVRRP